MPKIPMKTFRRVIIISLVIGLIFAMYPLIHLYLNLPLILAPDIFIMIGLAIALFPPGIIHLLNVMWRRGVDRNIPQLLRFIAESGRIGISIPKALAIASEYDLGPLTPELKKIVRRLTWGYPIEKVFEDAIEEIGTPTARRAFTLILEALKAGGDIEETMMVLQRHLSGIQLTLRERRAMMRPYISYGYMAFLVFLAIQVILLLSFFGPILEIQEQTTQTGAAPFFTFGIDKQTIKTYFYHISLIEAVISGLVSGKMGEGTIFAGIKHVVILLLTTVLTYYLIVKI